MDAVWALPVTGRRGFGRCQGEMAAGKRAIYYGDYKGLAVKVSEDVTIDVLRETKARQHVVEVLAFLEMDAKVQNAEMLAALEMAAA